MALLKYSLIRLATFCLVFAACMFLDLGRFTLAFAVLVGLLVSWAVAYLFFDRLRLAAGEQLAAIFSGRRRTGARQQADADAEDALAEQYHAAEGRPQNARPSGEVRRDQGGRRDVDGPDHGADDDRPHR
ncbi:DUF4229 domain-containing protein [Nesterenkonia sp. F]|uniref:DUF4229 domain-containing protein n=1 Tax=Nesterenkonia sp. F TaxID=795955 RepID=UPI000255CB07|nr:DUF4229 domain-containing protein [Nesterenkonia sp. F]